MRIPVRYARVHHAARAAIARKLMPRKFLLKGIQAIPRTFAPAKISRYTVVA